MPAATPEATPQAWLDRLPALQRLAAAQHTHEQLAAWLAGLLLIGGLAVFAARLDIVGRVRGRLAGTGVRPWLARVAATGAFAAIVIVPAALVGALANWREGLTLAAAGGGPGPALQACLSSAVAAAISLVGLACLLTPLLQGLIGRRPRTWPWLLGAGWTALCLLVLWAPYASGGFGARPPAPPGATTEALLALQSQAGLPSRPIGLDPGMGLDGDVLGAFGHARIVVGPELLAAGPAEARALIAHVMGHQVHGDLLAVSLLLGAVGLATLLAMQRLALPLARRLGPAAPADLADPRALPALVLVAVLGFAAGQLGGAAYLRWANVRADAYALSLTRDPAVMAASLEAHWDHAATDPWAPERWLFYSHPPLKERLGRILAWTSARPA